MDAISYNPAPRAIVDDTPPRRPHRNPRLHAAQHRLPHQYIARLVLSPVSQPPRATRDNVSSNRICDCAKMCYSTQPPANQALLGSEPFFPPCPSSVRGRLEPCLDFAFVTGDGSHSMQISETGKSSPSVPAPRLIPRHAVQAVSERPPPPRAGGSYWTQSGVGGRRR